MLNDGHSVLVAFDGVAFAGLQTVGIVKDTVPVWASEMVDGFVPLEEREFDQVRTMARRCNLPPYEKY